MFGGYRFAVTGSSDKLVRLWSIEQVYKQAAEATWGLRDTPHLTPADSAQSSHTAAVAEDGQEVSQGTPLPCQGPHLSYTRPVLLIPAMHYLLLAHTQKDVAHSRLLQTAGDLCLVWRLHRCRRVPKDYRLLHVLLRLLLRAGCNHSDAPTACPLIKYAQRAVNEVQS